MSTSAAKTYHPPWWVDEADIQFTMDGDYRKGIGSGAFAKACEGAWRGNVLL